MSSRQQDTRMMKPMMITMRRAMMRALMRAMMEVMVSKLTQMMLWQRRVVKLTIKPISSFIHLEKMRNFA